MTVDKSPYNAWIQSNWGPTPGVLPPKITASQHFARCRFSCWSGRPGCRASVHTGATGLLEPADLSRGRWLLGTLQQKKISWGKSPCCFGPVALDTPMDCRAACKLSYVIFSWLSLLDMSLSCFLTYFVGHLQNIHQLDILTREILCCLCKCKNYICM